MLLVTECRQCGIESLCRIFAGERKWSDGRLRAKGRVGVAGDGLAPRTPQKNIIKILIFKQMILLSCLSSCESVHRKIRFSVAKITQLGTATWVIVIESGKNFKG